MKKIKFILIIFVLLLVYMYILNITLIPQNIILMNGEKVNIKKLFGIQTIETTNTFNDTSNVTSIDIKLFGISVKKVNVTTMENIDIVPVGKVVGLKLYTNGVLIVGMSEIENKEKILIKPYENSNIKAGDTILKIGSNEIEDIEKLKDIVNNSNGNDLDLTLLRNGNIVNTSIKPVMTTKEEYKLGLWVKDAATGVGTMTFYEPITKAFAILGHGITDTDTDKLIDIDSGELVTSKIISLKKGSEGTPGEIKGTIVGGQTIGSILNNTQFGVFGTLNNLTALNIDTSKKVKVALRDEIKEGEATILCTFDNNVSKEYKIEIEKIYRDNDYSNKSMLIRITDDELLEKTGGIIRGLSGAPIIQNNKFVGAVTNVLVSNPKIGYGIFGDLMIKELNK